MSEIISINAIVGWAYSKTKGDNGKPVEKFFRIDFMHEGRKQSTRQYYDTEDQLVPILAELPPLVPGALATPIQVKAVPSVDQLGNPRLDRNGQQYINFYLQGNASYQLNQQRRAQAQAMQQPQAPMPQAPQPVQPQAPVPTPAIPQQVAPVQQPQAPPQGTDFFDGGQPRF